jgi:hypothetical protein
LIALNPAAAPRTQRPEIFFALFGQKSHNYAEFQIEKRAYLTDLNNH